MHWVKYFEHVRHSKRDRSVMAAVLLHVIGRDHSITLDVSALRTLSEQNRWATNSLIDWHFANPWQKMPQGPADVLREIIKSPARDFSRVAVPELPKSFEEDLTPP